MQADKCQRKQIEDHLDSDGQDTDSLEDLDEVLEVRLNKLRRSRLFGADLEDEVPPQTSGKTFPLIFQHLATLLVVLSYQHALS